MDAFIAIVVVAAVAAALAYLVTRPRIVSYKYTRETCPAQRAEAGGYLPFSGELYLYHAETETAEPFTRCSGCGFIGSPGMVADGEHVSQLRHP